MYKHIVSIMFTTMISFNYCLLGCQADCLNYVYHDDFITNCSQGCTSRLSQLCLPLWFHLTIIYNDVQADCLNYVYCYDFIWLLFTRMYKQIVSIMSTPMISFNYCSQGCASRLSQLCLPLWFHLTIVRKDVQADCLNYVYHCDFLYVLFTRMYKQVVSIMFTTMISFNYCSQRCTIRLSQLCLPLWFHLTIVHMGVQADCLNYVYRYDFI